jgi:hypothetical protein
MSAFLDELDVRSLPEREMLSEIARKEPLAKPERFLDDHRRAVAAIASLGRLAAHERMNALWHSIGWCGEAPKDQSRTFAALGIVLMVGVWIVLPTLLGLALLR